MGSLDSAIRYSASAGGDIDHPMGSVGFTQAELDALEEGQWLYNDGDSRPESAARPMTTDLAGLRKKECA